MKKCNKCNLIKDLSEFFSDKKSKDKLTNICKSCFKEYAIENKDKISDRNKKHYELNKPLLLEKKKEYYIKNKDVLNKKNKAYYETNKNDILIHAKEYREINNKIISVKRKDYYQLNKNVLLVKHSEYRNKRKKYDSAYKATLNIRRLFKICLTRKNIDKSQSFFSYTGIAYSDYVAYFENKYPIEFSQITEKGKYHIDHIIPCAIYDFNNPEHIKLCWQPENLRIIPSKENITKKDFLDYDLIDKHGIRHLLPK